MMNKTTATPKTDEAIKTNELTPAAKKAAHEKAIRDKNNKEMKAAKTSLIKFQETAEFKALPADVQANIKRVCGKQRVAGPVVDSFADQLKAFFPKVKTNLSELDIFMKTKMGRGEFRKRVRESLKKADVDARLWVEFDEDKEVWTLLAIGGDMPKGFRGKELGDPKK